MKVKKTKQQILESFFITQTEIGILFSTGDKGKKKIFKKANEIDEKNGFKIEETKVKLDTCCEVVGTTYEKLAKRLKKESKDGSPKTLTRNRGNYKT